MSTKDKILGIANNLGNDISAIHLDQFVQTPSFRFPSTLVEDPREEEQHKLLWSRIRQCLREPFSEFFGTMILILFGDGVVAQVLLSGGQKGDYQSISWGWG
jgi:aquaglyceroporin related protein